METTNNSAKFAFFYMLSLVALVFLALSVGMIVFQIINLKIADVLNQGSGSFSNEALKFAISSIIIAAPIYYLLTRLINKNLFQGTLNPDAAVRRWLTYVILFISAVVIIVWLITTINGFLNGELTLKSILKTLTVLVIAVLVFSYYLYDIRREQIVGTKNKVIAIFAYGSSVIVLAALISSFFYVESPKATRERKQDEAILNNFEQIDSAVNIYFTDNKKLPANLDVLIQDRKYAYNADVIKDPSSNEKFSYKTVGKDAYEICATFRTSNKQKDKNTDQAYNNDRWPHDAGKQCIKQSVHNSSLEKVIR